MVAAALAASFLIGLPCAAATGDQDTARPQKKPNDIIRRTQQALLKDFEGYLAKPKSYAARVRRECSSFPEGDLFPYLLPAYAYTNLGLEDPKFKPKAAERIAQLIELAKPAVIRRVRPPGGKLEKLTDYNSYAVYLGQFNLALGCYKLVGGDGRYDKAHKAASDTLHNALAKQQGRALKSLPTLTWSFDTIPCLLSLRLYDKQTGKPRSDPIISRHLKWLREHATDKATNLPFSRIDGKGGRKMEPPRGCELSWRVCLMAQLDAKYAKELYKDYVKSFWLDKGMVVGFAEWPRGRGGWQDVDSGPIVMGVGSTATVLGVGAAIATADAERKAPLCEQMANMKPLMKTLIAMDPKNKKLTMGGLIDPDSAYHTGFLFGDACLFYSVTWQNWSVSLDTNSKKPQADRQ